MNKAWFNVETVHIEIPEEELSLAIDKGIEQGRKKKYKKKTKMTVSIVTIAASLLLMAGFVFSPMTKVLASVPLFGYIYESLNMKMGKELESKNLVTELNQTASDNGVNVTLTSVYYDGIYVGITFKAEGKSMTNEVERNGSDLDYDYFLFDGQGVKQQWGGRIGDLQKVDNNYLSAIELEYPDKQLPKDFTLPITFTFMGGVEGTWKFDVPVTQLPLKTFTIENSTSQDGNYSFTLESMVIGASNMRINYTTSIPVDFMNLKISDDKGNELSDNTHLYHGDNSAAFDVEIDDDTKFLAIYPTYRKDGKSIELAPLKVEVRTQTFSN